VTNVKVPGSTVPRDNGRTEFSTEGREENEDGALAEGERGGGARLLWVTMGYYRLLTVTDRLPWVTANGWRWPAKEGQGVCLGAWSRYTVTTIENIGDY